MLSAAGSVSQLRVGSLGAGDASCVKLPEISRKRLRCKTPRPPGFVGSESGFLSPARRARAATDQPGSPGPCVRESVHMQSAGAASGVGIRSAASTGHQQRKPRGGTQKFNRE